VAQIRLLVPLTSLAGLFPIASNLPPPALFASTNGRRSPSGSILAIVTPTPGVVLTTIAVITVVGAGCRVFKTFKCMKHEGETDNSVLFLLTGEKDWKFGIQSRSKMSRSDGRRSVCGAKESWRMMHHDISSWDR
jgi:hypothetical protein